ncbi:MAG: hypothetical protein LBQ66_01600, partial [Planctomycetaceae bacterium]|nr:hypothetical protein [Planctomycetaceae bacterium]
GLSMFNTSGVVPIQTEHASTTIHGINVKINDSPEKMCGITRRNRPAVGYPPYVLQNILAFSSNLFGSITHRGGRDARVPVRRCFATNLCGITRSGCTPYVADAFMTCMV